jgi:hypothetical protein
MDVDSVVWGMIVPHGDHTHLEWVCPDCGSRAFASGECGHHRIVCTKTGRTFLVVGVPKPTGSLPGVAGTPRSSNPCANR